ncbi:HD family phosphohydrolase [Vreelandella arcis]|uniref:HD-GYP domain, c-di-GMP phosphodiesterase class II (Or its inactivated variant) n=1 Tax=Vreelandella arcis TaxID=416873 RepID=A0A1H0I3F6_9GAMM|nr:HD family phosphohydrolase [Halomonas arcis]SDO25919.1 HD-GYP domain, c-di-GMP phosphodiesterase class II (or its inactivated variant) [Halomonas arcis]
MNQAAGDNELMRIRQLNEVGIALSSERNHDALLERILTSARNLTQADAGTLYTVDAEKQQLSFAIVQNATLDAYFGGLSEPVGEQFPTIELYQEDGSPNQHLVVAYTVLNDCTVNIEDAYTAEGFDFSGTHRFDQKSGYRSRAFLTVPMHNHDGDIVAVLQLLNKRTAQGIDGAFSQSDQHIAESLASQAAVAITNQRLIAEMQALFDSFIRVIANAIDTKSGYTGAHCRRVPTATLLLAEATHRSTRPEVAHFNLSDDDRYEIKTAAWLHDCGKIVTPPHIMDKATKLEGLFDRLSLIETRFAAKLQSLEAAKLRAELDAYRNDEPVSDAKLDAIAAERQALQDSLALIRRSNTGREFMEDADIERLHAIAQQTWEDVNGDTQPLLTKDELENLCIRRGTLNPAERKVIEGHMTATLEMLEELPFPKHLQRVPEYAGGHHERMDGAGYPKGLTREQLSLPARMMGIADVFEALTAPDRPYKAPMKLSQALSIMGQMVEDNHLDPDLFAVFVEEKVYLDYARQHLAEDQCDHIDIASLPGLQARSPNNVSS